MSMPGHLTLVVTSSYDVTTDILLRNRAIPIDRIFRLNYDLIGEYSISVTPRSFEIVDRVGRVASLDTIFKCYLRKFERKITDDAQEKYADDELWYLTRAIIRQLWSLNRIVLVEPGAETTRLDKLAQLRFAAQHFQLPAWEFSLGRPIRFSSPIVVKSLSRGKVGDKVMNANRVDPAALDTHWPWFQQEIVEGTHDVTVVYVRGQQFAYRLSREHTVGRGRIDWKSDRAAKGRQAWDYFELPAGATRSIASLMQAMKLDFGRLDFLMKEGGELIFLEVNPNGQFAWLDLDDSKGVISAVCNEISPATPRNPLQHNPYL